MAGPQRLKPRSAGDLYGTTKSRALPERDPGQTSFCASKIGSFVRGQAREGHEFTRAESARKREPGFSR